MVAWWTGNRPSAVADRGWHEFPHPAGNMKCAASVHYERNGPHGIHHTLRKKLTSYKQPSFSGLADKHILRLVHPGAGPAEPVERRPDLRHHRAQAGQALLQLAADDDPADDERLGVMWSIDGGGLVGQSVSSHLKDQDEWLQTQRVNAHGRQKQQRHC